MEQYVSDFFAGLNGVKQGGVASPVFEPIDNPLVNLAQSGVVCSSFS